MPDDLHIEDTSWPHVEARNSYSMLIYRCFNLLTPFRHNVVRSRCTVPSGPGRQNSIHFWQYKNDDDSYVDDAKCGNFYGEFQNTFHQFLSAILLWMMECTKNNVLVPSGFVHQSMSPDMINQCGKIFRIVTFCILRISYESLNNHVY